MKLLFVSLGCDKNLVDSEYMIGMLTSHGIELTDDETEADIIIVNSCCFIGDAKEESINTILEMAEQKKTGCCKSLIVTGCLTQRYQDEVKKEIPEVDAILGTNSYDSIVEALEETLQHKFYKNFHTLSGLPQLSTKRTDRRTLCISENCRGMQQKLHLLCDPVCARTLPQCSDGRAGYVSRRTGCRRRKGTDPCCAGDNALRCGSVWEKMPA